MQFQGEVSETPDPNKLKTWFKDMQRAESNLHEIQEDPIQAFQEASTEVGIQTEQDPEIEEVKNQLRDSQYAVEKL